MVIVSELSHGGRLEGVESLGSGNRFADFVNANSERFQTYAVMNQQSRSILKGFETELDAHLNEYFNRSVTPPDQRHRNILRNLIHRTTFQGERARTLGLRDSLYKITRSYPHLRGTIDSINVFTADLNRRMDESYNPLLDQLNTLRFAVFGDVVAYLTSDYENLLDFESFLQDDKYEKGRNMSREFLTDLSADDAAIRAERKGEEAGIDKVNRLWIEKIKGGLIPGVFNRVMDAQETSPSASFLKAIVWLNFSAKALGISFQEGGAITAREARGLIPAAPFDSWPKELRESYQTSALKDISVVIERIRSNLTLNFKRAAVKTSVDIPFAEIETPSKKRNANGEIQQIERQLHVENEDSDESIGSGTQEADRQKLELGMLKPVSNGEGSHFADMVGEQEVLEETAKKGASPQMKEDLKALTVLLSNPLFAFGPGVKKLGAYASITVEGRRLRLRRFDPRSVHGMIFKDPETARWRIVFAIHEGRVLVRGIYHHDEFDKKKDSVEAFD